MSDIRTWPLHPTAVQALTAIAERPVYARPSQRAVDLRNDQISWEYAEQLTEAGPCIEPPVSGEPLRITDIGRARLEVSKVEPYVDPETRFGRRK